MCGIFGVISAKDHLRTLNIMGDALAHRGPDDRGTYINNNIALGHRRLSVIDLVSGHQPMLSQDKQQTVVYNGEIYNFKEIRKELIGKGHIFKTESDTEVLISAYREWGYDCLDRLNGMFAFALWDNDPGRLWLVRDRLGKKPLYFMKLNGAFYFASDAKALWGVPGFPGNYDHRAIDQYLTFRYVPGTKTFYKEITKLAPGHWMLVDRDSNIRQTKRWWSIPQHRDTALTAKHSCTKDYVDEFCDIFSSAVKLRMISDVPLGLFLSSGIDSSSIAFEMAKVSRPTFLTIGFGDKTDEIKVAALLAKKLGARHYPLLMSEKDFDLFPQAVASMDEPYGDPIILPTFLLAKKAAEKVKVILTGDGADEALGGYIHHDFFRKASKGLPVFSYKLAAAFFRLLPPAAIDSIFHYPASLGASGKDRLLNLLNSYPDMGSSFMNFSAIFSEAEKEDLYSSDFKASLQNEPDEIEPEMRFHFDRKDIGPFDKTLQWDMRTWFPEQTLMKLDRLAMSNSIEGRCPYADYRLIEFLFRMPLNVFLELSNNKKVIRSHYQHNTDFLPRKKQAFYLPLNTVFNSRSTELIREILNKERLKEGGWFKSVHIENLLAIRRQSPLLVDKKLMSLAVLLFWLNHQKEQANRDIKPS